MLENGAATIPDGDSIELLIAKGQSGELQQKQLIDLCNREMSKALTSQTLATEQGQNGSRAASEPRIKGRQKCQALIDGLLSPVITKCSPALPSLTLVLTFPHQH